MPLTDKQRAALRAAAEREGIDEAQLIAAAEAELEAEGSEGAAGEKKSASDKGVPAGRPDGRPMAERLLVGFLPFIKVVELRSIWLGLNDRIPDDELTCGDYAAKHGGATATQEES